MNKRTIALAVAVIFVAMLAVLPVKLSACMPTSNPWLTPVPVVPSGVYELPGGG